MLRVLGWVVGSWGCHVVRFFHCFWCLFMKGRLGGFVGVIIFGFDLFS
jgi:hypothetical protein